mmetsp:Transcript_19251/g.44947  ORF Transcript_19251/g.44947 Transcript_19251/m.44947 type:complete len:230 (-) Transcript_19251:28-717(-)
MLASIRAEISCSHTSAIACLGGGGGAGILSSATLCAGDFARGRCTDGEGRNILDLDGDPRTTALERECGELLLRLAFFDDLDLDRFLSDRELLELPLRFSIFFLFAARCGEGLGLEVIFPRLGAMLPNCDRATEAEGATLEDRSGGLGGLGSGFASAEPPCRKSLRKSMTSVSSCKPENCLKSDLAVSKSCDATSVDLGFVLFHRTLSELMVDEEELLPENASIKDRKS